jgi:hypothetical protein
VATSFVIVGGRTCSAAEDDDGERGELRRGKAGGIVFATEAAQQVDGRRVEAVGEIGRVGRGIGARAAFPSCGLGRHDE